jgi:S1-C subfamily serine protease
MCAGLRAATVDVAGVGFGGESGMADRVEEFSQALAGVVERTAPAIVRVEGRRRGPSTGVVWSEDVVVTADHVLEWDEDVTVGLPDGGTATGVVVGRDPGTDVAALRVSGARLAAPVWSAADGLKVGHLVLAVSRPGRTAQARLGIASALADAWRTPAGGRLDRYLQSDIAVHPGFSGSALVEASGRLLGLNTAGLLRATPLAVPSATVKRVVESLLAHGQVRRGFLGIGTQPVRLPAPLDQQLGQETALMVNSVQPDSPAARAGLLLGDVLVALEGHALRHPGELLPLLDEDRIGAEVKARVLRAGELRDLGIVVGARGAEKSAR